MHGENWNRESGAGGFSSGTSRHSNDIGSRVSLPEFHATKKITWREFFHWVVDVSGLTVAFLGVMFLAMVLNERYGIVPVLLTIIIVLMVLSPRSGSR